MRTGPSPRLLTILLAVKPAISPRNIPPMKERAVIPCVKPARFQRRVLFRVPVRVPAAFAAAFHRETLRRAGCGTGFPADRWEEQNPTVEMLE
jgi:hypothetical protein